MNNLVESSGDGAEGSIHDNTKIAIVLLDCEEHRDAWDAVLVHTNPETEGERCDTLPKTACITMGVILPYLTDVLNQTLPSNWPELRISLSTRRVRLWT